MCCFFFGKLNLMATVREQRPLPLALLSKEQVIIFWPTIQDLFVSSIVINRRLDANQSRVVRRT